MELRNLHSSPVLENIRMSFFTRDSTISLYNSYIHEFSNILKFLLLQSELFTFLRKEFFFLNSLVGILLKGYSWSLKTEGQHHQTTTTESLLLGSDLSSLVLNMAFSSFLPSSWRFWSQGSFRSGNRIFMTHVTSTR